MFETIWDTLVQAGVRLSDSGAEYGLVSYVGAMIVFVVILRFTRRRSPRWRAIWKCAFPKRIIAHASTDADLRFFVLNFVVLSSAYGLASVGSAVWARGTHTALGAWFGAGGGVPAPAWFILSVTTIVEVLAVDLGYWAGHQLMHRNPALWEFHKVHHSAEVMTPLTEWRQHPVEMVLMPNAIAVATGIPYGALAYLFGKAQPLTLWETNVLLVVFFVTWSHLRHSHVWLPFTGFFGRVLHSPAHHQIHHSTDPKHFNKNLGFALSIWDWLFGTLWVPREGERPTFGVGAESAAYHHLGTAVIAPFANAVRHVAPRKAQPIRSE